MNVILIDQASIRKQLLPLTFTRPTADMRIGILKISEKWERYLKSEVSYLTENYLSAKFPVRYGEDNLFVNGAVCPDQELVRTILSLKEGEAIWQQETLLAYRSSKHQPFSFEWPSGPQYTGEVTVIDRPWKLFKNNGSQIRQDFKLVTEGRISQKITDPHTRVYNEENIFIEEGVKLRDCTLNAENGPIYIGKNSSVEEGALVRGPFAMAEDSTVNAAARMRGDITVGPHCKIGGEVGNSILFGYSNKGHDGYLGNSILGEWCNLGADTNTSNLKNNYAKVKVWGYDKEGFVQSGEQFCGLIMGDHSKCGINTMFNTGTVVGVAANIFGPGFPRAFVPSFAWGGASGFSTYKLPKVYEMAEVSMVRRGGELNEAEKSIFEHIFEATSKYRVWEK